MRGPLFCTLRHGFNYGVREASRERARLQALTNRIDADMDRYGADLTRAARDVEEARSDDGRG